MVLVFVPRDILDVLDTPHIFVLNGFRILDIKC